ncbi:MAG: hypothetical protein GTO45_24675 [Candidatus Aminicenantes bacterium]|nr:hypothetical protein [Candidatus Aminicenantes bacterium]NIM81951.1 hypothetical protein [Candidatus Aminicenantes bacterium]NIN21327.1 hypothetical protein [Candidatus Aminicenantes bacterium]NIN45148.1 hypothetical protein [Candidatus Aminicenantes bacterium]NIN87965.1 hypothetical protein [Candidatus Aminicenantes bacterium]
MKRFLIVCGVILFIFAGVLFSQKYKSVAVITDTLGESTTVTEVKARYKWEANLIDPNRRDAFRESICVLLNFQEGRIKTTEKIEIFFHQVKRIDMEYQLKNKRFPGWLEKLQITKRDGSMVILKTKYPPGYKGNPSSYFEERSSKGEQTKAFGVKYFTFSFEKYHSLKSFEGKAKTRSGKVGDYYIPFKEIKSIVFTYSK